MCLQKLFCGNSCTWMLIVILVLILICNNDCEEDACEEFEPNHGGRGCC